MLLSRSVVLPARASRLPSQSVTPRKHPSTSAKRRHRATSHQQKMLAFFGKNERDFGLFAIFGSMKQVSKNEHYENLLKRARSSECYDYGQRTFSQDLLADWSVHRGI